MQSVVAPGLNPGPDDHHGHGIRSNTVTASSLLARRGRGGGGGHQLGLMSCGDRDRRAEVAKPEDGGQAGRQSQSLSERN